MGSSMIGPNSSFASVVKRINWSAEQLDAELSILAIHILVEMLQIPTPMVSPCLGDDVLRFLTVF